MKCDNCKFNQWYFTGGDEYPMNTHVPMCSKGKWEGDDELYQHDEHWLDCEEYEEKLIEA